MTHDPHDWQRTVWDWESPPEYVCTRCGMVTQWPDREYEDCEGDDWDEPEEDGA